jgi:hypothetical protein
MAFLWRATYSSFVHSCHCFLRWHAYWSLIWASVMHRYSKVNDLKHINGCSTTKEYLTVILDIVSYLFLSTSDLSESQLVSFSCIYDWSSLSFSVGYTCNRHDSTTLSLRFDREKNACWMHIVRRIIDS